MKRGERQRADTLLVVTTSYPRADDGSEAAGSFVADLVEELAKVMPVRVVAPGDVAATELLALNVTLYRYSAPPGTLASLRLGNPRDIMHILSVLHAGDQATARATQDGRVLHTLACWALPAGWWALRLLRRCGIPYSVWMLGSDVWSLGRVPLVRRILRMVMRSARHRFADGLHLASDSRQICGMEVGFLPSTRRMEMHAPREPALQSPYRLAFIGRWHPNKGVDLLLDALALLDDADWQGIAEVAIHGGGPLQDIVRGKVRPLLAAGRPVVVGGFIPKALAVRAIMRADYLLIPSRTESIPVIFSDAMKLGRPVIAMPVGDLPCLMAQAPCGVLAETVTAPALADAVRKGIATSPQIFSDGVKKHAANFDLASIADRIASIVATDV